MGACGSATAAAAPTAAGKDGGNQDVVERCFSLRSEMDFETTPGVEKRTISKGKKDLVARVGCTCLKGRKPAMFIPNQDSWCIDRISGNTTVHGVFDGHGEKGHMVSNFVKQHLVPEVTEAIQKQTVDKSIEAAFAKAQRWLLARPNLGVRYSGTTATIVAHDQLSMKLTVAHVGDSSAVLVKRKAGGTDGLHGVRLTRDHKPELQGEKALIEQAGGKVKFDGYCHRVTRRCGGGPGLNMSRSLGDAMAHKLCGVSSTPEVSEVSLGQDDVALLVCSDGIWEVITPDEAAQTLQDFGPSRAKEAAKALANLALRRWLEGTDGVRTDDITAIVTYLVTDLEPGPEATISGATIGSSHTDAPPRGERQWDPRQGRCAGPAALELGPPRGGHSAAAVGPGGAEPSQQASLAIPPRLRRADCWRLALGDGWCHHGIPWYEGPSGPSGL